MKTPARSYLLGGRLRYRHADNPWASEQSRVQVLPPEVPESSSRQKVFLQGAECAENCNFVNKVNSTQRTHWGVSPEVTTPGLLVTLVSHAK